MFDARLFGNVLSILWLLPILLSFIGLIHSSSRKPVGGLYWTAFGLLAAQYLYAEVMIGFAVFSWRHISSEALGWNPLLLVPVPVILLLLTANTFWVIGQDRRIPSDAGEDARKELRGLLKRRLWLPVLAIPLLQIALSVVPAILGVGRARPRPVPPSSAVLPTATSGMSPTSTITLPASSAEENRTP